MRYLRKIKGITRLDRVRNENITEQLKVKPILTLVEERQLGWMGHLLRMDDNRIAKRVYEARTERKNAVGRPRRKWEEQVKIAAENRNIQWRKSKEPDKRQKDLE
ncbi:hypothetical protein RN001_013183 [Aquatica leii]|uniref:Endonuclease-reverse transcriptase n=1 Tax=Aquatica leii TaxID=1421715 RepID=A0AAN7SLH6_9COLE|nr:hypothetical protein RN001_013183 [Aquatica leii]